MQKKVQFLILGFSLSFFFSNGYAAEIVLAGTYQGKNLYVQNPFTGNMQDFCATEVFINNTKAHTNINSSAFEIDLSFLQLDEEVVVKIIHKDDCKPKILNASVIKSATNFHFVSFSVEDQHLAWSTKSEKQKGKFFVEHFLHHTWVIVGEVESKGGIAQNSYQAVEHHHSGANRYRIRFKDVNGHSFYSKVLEFNSTKPTITFSPKKPADVINLSHHTHYEIIDANGTSLLKGSGSQVSVANLKPGNYFINIDNRTEKFTKR